MESEIKFYMKPFVKFYLKKQQAQFVKDLKEALKPQEICGAAKLFRLEEKNGIKRGYYR